MVQSGVHFKLPRQRQKYNDCGAHVCFYLNIILDFLCNQHLENQKPLVTSLFSDINATFMERCRRQIQVDIRQREFIEAEKLLDIEVEKLNHFKQQKEQALKQRFTEGLINIADGVRRLSGCFREAIGGSPSVEIERLLQGLLFTDETSI